MTDSPHLLVSGGGSVSVSSDALIADSQSLRALSLSLPSVSAGLRFAAGLAGPQEARALGSWRAREADAGITSARQQLDLAIGECARIADALDTAGRAYAEAEREATDRFLSLVEPVASVAGQLVGKATKQNTGVALLAACLSAAQLRVLFGGTIGPNDIDLPADLNRLISDPRVVRMLRALIMTGDEFVEGVVEIPARLRDGASQVGLSALVLMGLGSMAGLFAARPVNVAPAGGVRTTRPASSIAERAGRVPNAVAGDAPQVRIETYRQEGMPDRFDVYVGGTVDFSPLAKDEPFDLTSNLELEAGLPAGAYEGVREAMALAGITADSEIVITGHSQGGLVAARLAASEEYTVSALVTLGAPAGQIVIPSSVPALIIENTDDLVPALGGLQQNEDALVVRAQAYPDPRSLPVALALPAHRIEAYVETARAIDENARSAQLVEFREHLAEFTRPYTLSSSQDYLVTRGEQ